MNINENIINACSPLGLPAKQDIYTGREDKWVTFTYVYEKPNMCTDDNVDDDIAQVYVHLFTPIEYNYMDLKHSLRDNLTNNGFNVYNIQSYAEEKTIRHTIFECEIIKERNEQ